MLIEMSSPVFMEKGQVRPPIAFKEGLNVILGKEDGENSIGKSSALLAIDFVFGGNTYVTSDGVKHIGHHTIFFAFEFDDVLWRFARNTDEPDKILVCKEGYEPTQTVWKKEHYTDWLKASYKIDFPALSFRTTVGSFFRIYGKDNTDERRPLLGVRGQSMQRSIDMLVKLYDRYRDIEAFAQKQKDQADKLAAYNTARKYRFVSDLVGGKEQYDANLATINDLEQQLATLTVDQSSGHSKEDIEKGKLKAQLDGDRLLLETEIQARQRRLKLLDMSLEYGLYPTEADLLTLQEFFPDVNLRKLYEVERYHQKLANILNQQFAEESEVVKQDVAAMQAQVEGINKQINDLGFVGNISKEFLDRHSELKGRIDALKVQNEAYLTLVDLKDAKKRADELLKKGIESILADIEQELNDKMKELNDSLFDESRKAPRLRFFEYNSYRFETPDDTGTGSNYKGMVIYDLAVLQTSALPAIAHDSLILKNISDGAIDGIMRIYAQSKKQVFIAFDKHDAYSPATKLILENSKVLKLSDNGHELYGQSWNKEEQAKHENEL